MENYSGMYRDSLERQSQALPEVPEGINATNMKVIGIGGAGCNAINRMIEDGVSNVDFIAVNTDVQALHKTLAEQKLAIGTKSTRGLGAGAKPAIGENAANEDIEKIKQSLKDTDMVFITAGMGGGTGTGAAPVFAKAAKESGALTVAVVTLPFEFEGGKRMAVAQEGIEKLKEHVDTMLVISNARIYQVIERRMGVREAFKKIDEVLKQAVLGISSIISDTATINVDFADVNTVLSNKGEAIMGIGMANGDGRAEEAARMALENPLIENTTFRNAGSMLIYIIGGSDFSMFEFNEAANTVTDYCREGAEIITGLNIDDKLKDKVKVIIVATDFQKEIIQEKGTEPIAAEDIFQHGKVIDMKELQHESAREQRGFRTFTTRNRQEESRQSREIRHNEPQREVQRETQVEQEFEDELDIPAFLRKRNKRMG